MTVDRGLAWRVFTDELAASVPEERGADGSSPAPVLSPLGARIDRVLIAGTAGPVASVGHDPARPLLRAPLRDPNGTVLLTSGALPPMALVALGRIGVATGVLLVGRVHLLDPGSVGDRSVIAVEVEQFRPATGPEIAEVHRETAGQTMERIALARRLRAGPPPSDEDLVRAGYPATWIPGARRALERFPSVDPETFRHASDARTAEATGTGGRTARSKPQEVRPLAERTESARRPEPHTAEGIFLELIDDLVERSHDGLADLAVAAGRAARFGLDTVQIEEIVDRLEAVGVLEEATVGKIRRT